MRLFVGGLRIKFIKKQELLSFITAFQFPRNERSSASEEAELPVDGFLRRHYPWQV